MNIRTFLVVAAYSVLGSMAVSGCSGKGGETTGAGTGGGMASGGGTATGGGTGGGGSTGAGLFTVDTFAFYRPRLIADGAGVLHLVFNTNTSPSTVQYGRCAADCGTLANWTFVTLATDQFSGSTRLVAGSDNRLHLLFELSRTSGPSELIYATCGSNCTTAASWTKTNLASLFNNAWNSPTWGAPLVIDSQNRLSFTVDQKIYLNGGVAMATCASNCSTLSNWAVGTISTTGTNTALAATGTTLHQIIDNAPGSGSANRLAYRTCTANCLQASSWQELMGFYFVYDGAQPLAFSATAQGGLRLAYNQGASDASEPPAVRAQDHKMLQWGCDGNCLQSASWSGFVTGAVDDGKNGLSMVSLGEASGLAVSNGGSIVTRICLGSCLVEANWQAGELDTVTALSAEMNPFTYAQNSCAGSTVVNASWTLGQGAIAVKPDGTLAFAHTTSMLRTCASSTAVVYVPGFGRIVYLP